MDTTKSMYIRHSTPSCRQKPCHDVINKFNFKGEAPLHLACWGSHFEVVKCLTSHPECDLEVENNNKEIPLHVATQLGDIDIVHHLVKEKHCDIHCENE